MTLEKVPELLSYVNESDSADHRYPEPGEGY